MSNPTQNGYTQDGATLQYDTQPHGGLPVTGLDSWLLLGPAVFLAVLGYKLRKLVQA